MAIEIVNLPIKNGDVPWFFVCLPEGTTLIFQLIDGKHPMIFRVSTILLVQDFATIHISVISSQRSLHCLGGSHLTITTRPLDYVCIYTYIYILCLIIILYIIIISVVPPVFPDPCVKGLVANQLYCFVYSYISRMDCWFIPFSTG